MKNYNFDLFIIGGGSGGVRAGRMAASFGKKVAVAEERYLGGTCVNVGCIPKKIYSYAAHFSEDFEDSRGFGWSFHKSDFTWDTLKNKTAQEIKRLNGIYRKLLEEAGATIYEEHAVILDKHTLQVGGQTVTSERILVATGGWPFVPDIEGKEHAITSNEAFSLEKFPERVVVVGGGYIAIEFAGIFNGLGAKTHLIYRGPLFLRGFDDDTRKFLAQEVSKKGVDLKFDADIKRIEKNANGYAVVLHSEEVVECDLIMYATGRKPLTKNIGLQKCGVKLNEKGAIVVNSNYQTSVDSIYAIGDVTDRINLTPVALAEGMALTAHLYQDTEKFVSYEYIPSAVFSNPNLATVGYTESDAKTKFGDIIVYRSSFTPLKHTLSGSEEKTFLKLLVDRKSDRVVGAHMVGADAGELIQGIAVALKAGATKSHFDQTIGIHPTTAEEWVTMRTPA